MLTNRLFPATDSVLLAATVWAVGISAARVLEGGSTAYWSAFVAGVVTFAGAFFFGGRRGRSNVDGVFLGPRPRICAMLFLVAAIGTYVLQGPTDPVENELVFNGGRERPIDCGAATEDLLDKIDAAAQAGHQNCGDLVILRQAATPLKTRCLDEGSANALKAYQDTIRKYQATCQEPTQKLAAAIVQPIGKDKLIHVIKGDPPGVEVEIPAIPDGSPDQEPPATGEKDRPSSPDVGESGGKTAAADGRTRVSYSAGMREQLLRILLAIMRLQFPLLSLVSEKELLQGILNSNPENRGEPLRRLFDDMKLSPAARSQLTAYLLRTAKVAARADPDFARGVHAFVAADLATGICFGLISRVTEKNASARPESPEKTLMDTWRDQERSQRDRTTNDVEECIRANTDGEDTRAALEEFEKDRGVAIGS